MNLLSITQVFSFIFIKLYLGFQTFYKVFILYNTLLVWLLAVYYSQIGINQVDYTHL